MASKKGSLADLFFGTVTVGERGQVVIPAEARKRFGIESGDKLLAFSHPMSHCFSLVKIDAARDFMEQISDLIERQAAEETPEQ